MSEERYKTGEAWGIPFVFDTASIMSIDNMERLYNLQHIEDPDFPSEKKNPLEIVPLCISAFGDEQWSNIKRSLKEMGKDNWVEAINFYFECMQAASEAEGVELKN